uniref:Uncharacterized protein n=1 Tax=Arundo donax TaxID=35708 RepID=A0A0A9DL67_ARUDO
MDLLVNLVWDFIRLSLWQRRLWCPLRVQRQISSMYGKPKLTAALMLSRKKLILRKC